MDKKRLHRNRSESCDRRRKISVFKWVVVGLTFAFWVYLTTSVVLLPGTTPNTAPKRRTGQVWKPHQLTHREYSTGQLSHESFYTGTYIFAKINSGITRNFRIHFPIEVNTIEEKRIEDNDLDSPSTCLWTHTGAKGYDVPNQDRSVVIADPSFHSESGWSLMALFDGHGDFGHFTSHVAVTDLPSLILDSVLTESSLKVDSLSSPNSIAERIKMAFQKIDTTGLISLVPQGGSTAVVVLQMGCWVHIASVGDSTAVLVQWLTADTYTVSKHRIIATAVRHKPSDPLERKRIEENGGLVYIPINPNETSRVIFDVIDEDGRQKQTGLAMSRSLGDTPGKQQNVVIADPDVLSINLNDYIVTFSKATNEGPRKVHFFVVLASDGVTDMVSLDDVVRDVGNALYNPDTQDNVSTALTLSKTCRTVVNRAAKAWNLATNSQYRDDISLAVHGIM
jgi:serine/threonine protein phosphatase PrpC